MLMVVDRDYEACIGVVRREVAQGATLESAIQTMKDAGCSPVDCIRGVMEITSLPLAEATKVMHFSKAWQGVWEGDD